MGITHAVSNSISQHIKLCLANIECEHDVRILYACESGSRAWGFESQDSDYDVRFIYVKPLKWHLTIEPQRDVIEAMLPREVDIAGWELKKALYLFKKGNTSLIEWLYSPIVYTDDDHFAQQLRQMLTQQFSAKSAIYHYTSMAKKNNRNYLQGERVRLKKYFYVLRPIFCAQYIERYAQPAPIEFEDLMNQVNPPEMVQMEVYKLLQSKRMGYEMDNGQRIDVLNIWMAAEISRLRLMVENMPKSPAMNTTALDSLFQHALGVA